MHKSKIITISVITAAIISFIGLGWVQYKWLEGSIDTNRQIFEQKIDIAASMVGDEFNRNHTYHQMLAEELNQASGMDEASFVILYDFIDSVMVNRLNLNLEFTYGIYAHVDEGDIENNFVKRSGVDVPDSINLNTCSNELDLDFGWATLDCRHEGNPNGIRSFGRSYEIKDFHYHLGIFFPSSNLYVMSQIKEPLSAALVFIILLTACFLYTIFTIFMQKKLSQIKNDFINNLTHEFKTPIFSIDLASSILRNSHELANSEKMKSFATLIGNENQRLKNHVDKVLQMALVDSNNFKLEKKEIDIHTLIKKVVENFELLVKEQSGELKMQLQAKNTSLSVDEVHMKNIIYNLLDNAMKYSPKKPSITITTQDGEDGLELQIKDKGIGMNEQVQKYIFDKFYRANAGDVHEVKGFGLGLSYVKSVIDAHKAQIQLASKPNIGTTFTLIFKA